MTVRFVRTANDLYRLCVKAAARYMANPAIRIKELLMKV
jgi:hypothetical protein